MYILSAISYFFSHHSLWAMPVILILCGMLGVVMMVWRRNSKWLLLTVAGFVLGMINIFTSHMVNALFLNAVGVTGSAIIVHSEQTNSTLNDQYIWRYDAVLKTADGRDATTSFDTMSASIWPVRNSIMIPPDGQIFVVKYVPGFERNIVIMSDESDYGRQRLIGQDLEPVEKAAAQFAFSPGNQAFVAEYRDALRTFIQKHQTDADSTLVRGYQRTLDALGPSSR